MSEIAFEIRILQTLGDIDPEQWDQCAAPEQKKDHRPYDPFTTHRFLFALECSGSVGDKTGWYPYYITAYQSDILIGCAPMYLKTHSQGEYIFDHNWAHAYERAGGQYYPKLQVAVPFTPVPGTRLLTHPDFQEQAKFALVQGIKQFAKQHNISSCHITFCNYDEYAMGPQLGFLQRVGQQFHWKNNNYQTFDDFLDKLSSRKRKNIRKERETAQSFGGTITRYCGQEIKTHHWDAFWQFYQDTGARKWGQPYLTRSFFDIADQTLRDDMVLILAEHNGKAIAGALNFVGQNTLYGRYWGCKEDHKYLHFECCYYQAIDYAIENNLMRIEAGAQGEHKLARGYMPSETYSLHWFANPSFDQAVAQYLDHERKAVGQDIEILTQFGPFKSHTNNERD